MVPTCCAIRAPSPVPEAIVGFSPDRSNDTLEAPRPGLRGCEERIFPGAGDYSESVSHGSAAFLMIPRLDDRMNPMSSSLSSPGGTEASILSTAWVVLRSE